MIEEYSKEQLAENLKIVLSLEWLGIRIEDVKEEKDRFGFSKKTVYYYSVPESSTIEVADETQNAKIKTSDGLKLLAKETLIDMLINSCRDAFPDDKEFIEDVKNNISDYFKCYAKVRTGEVWSKDLGEKRVEELCKEIVDATGYKEV